MEVCLAVSSTTPVPLFSALFPRLIKDFENTSPLGMAFGLELTDGRSRLY